MSLRGTAGPIKSVRKLAQALGLGEDYLKRVARMDDSLKYKSVTAPAKQDGQPRQVYSPSPDVRIVQARIVKRFFKNPHVVRWPPYIFGGIHRDALPPGEKRDHVACAQKHCGARSLLKLDIRNFFDNVNYDMVVELMVQQLGWTVEPAQLLADLCTRAGCLPQGGITSSYLALLSLYEVESHAFRIISYKNLVYTRYVDDITISSKVSTYDYAPIVKIIEQGLLSKGLSINAAKTSIRMSGLEPLLVHGLNVAHKHPTLPKAEVKRIKAVSRQTVNDAGEEGRRTNGYRKRYHRSMGLVNKMARVSSTSHKPALDKLKAVRPLPNFIDYEIATETAHTLRSLYASKKTGYWYWRKFNVLLARLDLIGIENPDWAKTLRQYMKNHYKPEFQGPK